MHAKPDLRAEFEPSGHCFRIGDLCCYVACEMRRMTILAIAIIVVPLIGCEVRCSPLLASLDQLAANIFDGDLAIDENGVCKLGPNNRVVGNVAYVTNQSDGSKLILFRRWQGKGSNLRGVLYTNGPPLPVGTDISIVTFAPTGPTDTIPVSRVDVTIGEKIAAGCYNVSRSLD